MMTFFVESAVAQDQACNPRSRHHQHHATFLHFCSCDSGIEAPDTPPPWYPGTLVLLLGWFTPRNRNKEEQKSRVMHCWL